MCSSDLAGLVIEMVAPTIALKPGAAILHQPIQTKPRLSQVLLLPAGQIQSEVTLGKETHAFAAGGWLDPEYRPEIEREPPHALLPELPKPRRTHRQDRRVR